MVIVYLKGSGLTPGKEGHMGYPRLISSLKICGIWFKAWVSNKTYGGTSPYIYSIPRPQNIPGIALCIDLWCQEPAPLPGRAMAPSKMIVKQCALWNNYHGATIK